MNQQPSRWPALSLDHFPQEETQTNNLFLITGESGAGKTTYCQQWVAAGQAVGWRVGGLLSLPVIVDGRKTAISLLDVAGGRQRPIARLRQHSPFSGSVATGKWLFDPDVLIWGNKVLQRITAVDLLIIDELGPLEFKQGQGLEAAFKLITAGDYRLAAVVVRSSLIAPALRRWPWAKTVSVSRGQHDPRS